MKRTPLQRRTELVAKSRLDSTSIPRRRTRMKQVSARRRNRDAAYPQARAYVYERSRGACEAWAHADDCSGRCDQVHHIAGRGGDDPHRPDNLKGLSSACHRHVHANPEWAYRMGLMVRRHGGEHGYDFTDRDEGLMRCVCGGVWSDEGCDLDNREASDE